jgi:hypothetical protein
VARKVILHLTGEDPVVGDIDQDPEPGDQFVKVSNLTKRDGKAVSYLAGGVQSVLYPWHRILFLEVMPSEEERASVVELFRT